MHFCGCQPRQLRQVSGVHPSEEGEMVAFCKHGSCLSFTTWGQLPRLQLPLALQSTACEHCTPVWAEDERRSFLQHLTSTSLNKGV